MFEYVLNYLKDIRVNRNNRYFKYDIYVKYYRKRF